MHRERLAGLGMFTVQALVVVGMFFAAGASKGSPNATTWRRESLLGENGSHYFILDTRWVNTGTHYAHTEYQRVLMIDKHTGAIAETSQVRKTVFRTDYMDNSELEKLEEGVGAFDLSAYIRKHAIHAPFNWGSRTYLDSTGISMRIYLQNGTGRRLVVPFSKIHERLPDATFRDLALLGADFTSARPDSGLSRMVYFRLADFSAGSDVDADEIIMMTPEPR